MSLEAWGDDGDADRPYTQERVDEIVAEATQSILAERDALAEREGKLRQALRLRSILPLWAPNLSTRIASKCALCGEEWPTHGAESHAPDCLAKEPDGVREEK
jgi:hypothetical protein